MAVMWTVNSRFKTVLVMRTSASKHPIGWTQWNWSNKPGTWSVKVLVVDEELDTDELVVDVVVLNRAPTFNLTHPGGS